MRPIAQAAGSTPPGGIAVGLKEFIESYMAGMNANDVRKLFQRDAPAAYRVLTRDQPRDDRASGRAARWLDNVRRGFRGLMETLSPPRRLLFGVAMAAVILGLLSIQRTVVLIPWTASPVSWLLLAVGLLTFLLAIELVDRIRVRDELEVARHLQRELLPKVAPELPGYRFAHSFRTANEVGGDYYDFLPLPDGRLVVVAGDASGHGMAAGLLMAIANATLKTAVDFDPSPERVVDLLNRVLVKTGDRRAFMTMFYGVLDPASGVVQYQCAAHPFPLVRRRGGGVEEFGAGSFPLGIRGEGAWETGEIVLDEGDLLVLYSDGLAEAMRPDAEQPFGFERVRAQVAAGGTPQQVHDRIWTSLNNFLRSEPLLDDVSVVVVGREPFANPAGEAGI